jgi:hypothetical protein
MDIFKNKKQMNNLEMAFNYHLIFPLLEAAVKSTPAIEFKVGETKLPSITR